jgi:hypothetical protein
LGDFFSQKNLGTLIPGEDVHVSYMDDGEQLTVEWLNAAASTSYVDRNRFDHRVSRKMTKGTVFSRPFLPGANPTTLSYNASVVKIYNASSSLVLIF